MKLKEREDGKSLHYLRNGAMSFFKTLSSKKVRLVVKVVSFGLLIVFGVLIGLLVSGFFGTLDNPSQTALDALHSIGFGSLRGTKLLIEGILTENVMIPVNYLKGQFSNPEKITIDISFKNYQKLEYKRQQALERGVLITSSDDYVSATITHNGELHDVKLRLKGDWVEHLEGDKWSFRIKIKGEDTLFGMKVFSIQHPKTRVYINELIYHLALKDAGLPAIRYQFIEVIVNGEYKGIYALEEHFSKELIENNNRRAGVILRFNEDLSWKEYVFRNHLSSPPGQLFTSGIIDTFENNKMLKNPVLAGQFETGRGLLESFRKGILKTSEVFDVDKLAKYYSISTLLNCQHGSGAYNIRFYYNPVTSLIEPIGFDGWCVSPNAEVVIGEFIPDCLDVPGSNCSIDKNEFWDLIFSDSVFFVEYMAELERVSQKSYLDGLFSRLGPDITRGIDILHKDFPSSHFSVDDFYESQNQIRDLLNPIKSMNVYFEKALPAQDKIILYIGNINRFPIEVLNVEYNGAIVFELNQFNSLLQSRNLSEVPEYKRFEFKIPSGFEWNNSYAKDLIVNYKIFGTKSLKKEEVFPWAYLEEGFAEEDFIRQKPNFESFGFLEIDRVNRVINIKEGFWVLNESLIIPSGFEVVARKGTSLDLVNGALILSRSKLRFDGSGGEIKIFSSDKTGQGVVVLDSEERSYLKNVVFEGLSNPSKTGWVLTGAVTFYNSPVELDGVKFSGMLSEDSLNTINSNYEIKNVVFEDCFSDCFDDDFSGGIIKDSSFSNCGNDCIDISGAETKIESVNIFNAGDKGISGGEECSLDLKDIKIEGGFIGVASKDDSNVSASGIEILNVEYGFAVYQKKPEFGPGLISAIQVSVSGSENDYIVEKNSELSFNGDLILEKKEKVYETLYGAN